MKRLLFIFFLCVSPELYAGNYLKVIYIADHKTDCGNSKKCLLTRDSPTGEWKTLDQPIVGFLFEPGYEYCILAEIQTPDPSDSIRIKYVLNEVKSKTKTDTSKIILHSSWYLPDSSKWMLYKLKMKDGTKTFSMQKAYLQFGYKDELMTGYTECNTFHASFTIDSTKLKLDDMVVTKITCGKHSIEHDFLNALNQTTHYKITPKLLYLFKGKYLMALFTRKK